MRKLSQAEVEKIDGKTDEERAEAALDPKVKQALADVVAKVRNRARQ
jgi:hypothetical protein